MERYFSFSRRLVSFFRPFWKWFVLIWVLQIMANLFLMSYSLAVGKIIDAINQNDFNLAFRWVYFFLGFSIAGKALYSSKWIVDIRKLDYKVSEFIMLKTLEKTNELSIGQHQNQNSGLKQSIIQKGADGISRLAEMVVSQLSHILLQTMVAVAVMFFWDWKLATALLSYIVFFSFLVYLLNKDKEKLNRVSDLEHASYKAFTEYLRNIAMFLMNANTDRGIQSWHKKHKEMEVVSRDFWQRYVFKQSSLMAANTVFLALILFYSIVQCRSGILSAGQIVTFLFWSNMAINSLQNLGDFQRQLVKNSVDIRKYFVFLDIVPAIRKPLDGRKELFTGDIEYSDVSFAFPFENYLAEFEENKEGPDKEKAKLVLNGLSFKIHSKEKVAIVGLSGAGKSTLLSLLMRAYLPDTGTILLDGINYD